MTLITLDIEVSELILVLIRGHNSQVFFEVLLLKVLLGQILEVSLAEWNGGLENDRAAIFSDRYGASQVSSFVLDLDLSLQKGLKVIEDDDVVFNWEFAVDGKLQIDLLLLFLALLAHNLLAHFLCLLYIIYLIISLDNSFLLTTPI